jgi:ABC-type antimicrobial peptide transport system permease subunit
MQAIMDRSIMPKSMLFGAVLGTIIGALIPTSLQMSANTHGMPVLDALMLGRSETAILTSFLLSILATIVGAWIGGRNLIRRELRKE